MKQTGVFISGTDTGIGKTFVSALILSSLRAHGVGSSYFKPVQTGLDSDTQTVSEILGVARSEFPDPVYFFPEPMAPSRAAALNGVYIQLDQLVAQWQRLSNLVWTVEGAGGLLVPLNSRQTMRDLCAVFDLPLVLVSSTRLGTINHTLLSLEAARNLDVRGLVLVGDEDPGLDAVLQNFSPVPVLTRVPRLDGASVEELRKKAIEIFPVSVLKRIYGEGLFRNRS